MAENVRSPEPHPEPRKCRICQQLSTQQASVCASCYNCIRRCAHATGKTREHATAEVQAAIQNGAVADTLYRGDTAGVKRGRGRPPGSKRARSSSSAPLPPGGPTCSLNNGPDGPQIAQGLNTGASGDEGATVKRVRRQRAASVSALRTAQTPGSAGDQSVAVKKLAHGGACLAAGRAARFWRRSRHTSETAALQGAGVELSAGAVEPAVAGALAGLKRASSNRRGAESRPGPEPVSRVGRGPRDAVRAAKSAADMDRCCDEHVQGAVDSALDMHAGDSGALPGASGDLGGRQHGHLARRDGRAVNGHAAAAAGSQVCSAGSAAKRALSTKDEDVQVVAKSARRGAVAVERVGSLDDALHDASRAAAADTLLPCGPRCASERAAHTEADTGSDSSKKRVRKASAVGRAGAGSAGAGKAAQKRVVSAADACAKYGWDAALFAEVEALVAANVVQDTEKVTADDFFQRQAEAYGSAERVGLVQKYFELKAEVEGQLAVKAFKVRWITKACHQCQYQGVFRRCHCRNPHCEHMPQHAAKPAVPRRSKKAGKRGVEAAGGEQAASAASARDTNCSFYVCTYCLQHHYPHLPAEDDSTRICPRCRGCCNCKVHLRVESKVVPQAAPKLSPEEERAAARLNLSLVAPSVAEVVRTWLQEAAADGVSNLLQVRRESLGHRVRCVCSRCQTTIADLHRVCPDCTEDFCFQCCSELRAAAGSAPHPVEGSTGTSSPVFCPNPAHAVAPRLELARMLPDGHLRAMLAAHARRDTVRQWATARGVRHSHGVLPVHPAPLRFRAEKAAAAAADSCGDSDTVRAGSNGAAAATGPARHADHASTGGCTEPVPRNAQELKAYIKKHMGPGDAAEGPWVPSASQACAVFAAAGASAVAHPPTAAALTAGEWNERMRLCAWKIDSGQGLNHLLCVSSADLDERGDAPEHARALNDACWSEWSRGKPILVHSMHGVIPWDPRCMGRATTEPGNKRLGVEGRKGDEALVDVLRCDTWEWVRMAPKTFFNHYQHGEIKTAGEARPRPGSEKDEARPSAGRSSGDARHVASSEDGAVNGADADAARINVEPGSAEDDRGVGESRSSRWQRAKKGGDGEGGDAAAAGRTGGGTAKSGRRNDCNGGARGTSKPDADGAAMLKLKDYPPQGWFSEQLPRHNQDFMNMLPLQHLTRSDAAANNLATMLGPDCCPTDLGPKCYIACGRPEEAGAGDSVTRLHLDMSDAINVLLHQQRLNVPPETSAAGRPLTGHTPWQPPHYNRWHVQGAGAVWDIWRREDLPKLRTFLRECQHLFHDPHTRSGHVELPAWDDPVLSQRFMLTDDLRRLLWLRHGVQAWHIEQHEGEGVLIPAGCAHQVRNLDSCIKVAVDFVSPHNLGLCLHMARELRARRDPAEDISKLYAQSPEDGNDGEQQFDHEDRLQAETILVHAVHRAVDALHDVFKIDTV